MDVGLEPPAAETGAVDDRRLWGAPGAERMYFDAAECYESEIDPWYDEEPERKEWVIEEWDVHDPIDHIPKADWIIEWLDEHICENFSDPDACDLSFFLKDTQVLAAVENMRSVMAHKVHWRMARKKLADHKVTFDAKGEPLLDGEPMYVKAPPGHSGRGRAADDVLCPCGHPGSEHDEMGACHHPNRSARAGHCKCSEWAGVKLMDGWATHPGGEAAP